MSKIEISDLPSDSKISKEDMKRVLGGGRPGITCSP